MRLCAKVALTYDPSSHYFWRWNSRSWQLWVLSISFFCQKSTLVDSKTWFVQRVRLPFEMSFKSSTKCFQCYTRMIFLLSWETNGSHNAVCMPSSSINCENEPNWKRKHYPWSWGNTWRGRMTWTEAGRTRLPSIETEEDHGEYRRSRAIVNRFLIGNDLRIRLR